MKAIKSLSALFFCLALADVAVAQMIKCEPASSSRDAACDGTLAAPCTAMISDGGSGGLSGTYRVTYTQPSTDFGTNEQGMCKDDGCEDFTKTIFVTADGSAPSAGTDIQLSNYGIFNLCDEACLEPGALRDPNDFTGVCQHRAPLTSNCKSPAANADAGLCITALKSQTDNTYDSIEEVGSCELGSAFGDDGNACTLDDPCEVKIFGYDGDVDDIVEIMYTQPESDDTSIGDLCSDPTRGATSCEMYEQTIFAKVVAGPPASTEVELSPTALNALCVGQCSDGTVFSGVCQAAPTDCVTPVGTEPVCGVSLIGTVTYELSSAPPPENTTAAGEPTMAPTLPTIPDTTTTTEGPTSAATGLVAVACVTALLLA